MKIYVGNLSFQTSEAELRELFGQFGEVEHASVITDRATGRSRGFGFIVMADVKAGRVAVKALDGKDIEGRTIHVSEARRKVGDKSLRSGRDLAKGTSGLIVDANINDDIRFDTSGQGKPPKDRPVPRVFAATRRSIEFDVYVGDVDEEHDQVAVSELRNAIIEGMGQLGFDLDPERKPTEEFGSWWAKLWFKSRRTVTSRQMKGIYAEVRESLRRHAIDEVGAEVFAKRADGIGKLMSQLEEYDEVALRVGDVLIAKAVVNGKARLLIETISPALQRDLETNPTLMRNPAALIGAIEYHTPLQTNPGSDQHSA